MAELSADIIVRAQQAQSELNKAVRGFDRAGKEAKSMGQDAAKAGVQVDNLTANLKQAGVASDSFSNASARVVRSNRSSQQAFFQLGQAVSDFQAAGLRGAINNIEFLAFQLGVGGPLILAITAAGAAFIAFGDDIKKAFSPIKEEIKQIAEGLEGLIEISEGGNFRIVDLKNLERAKLALQQQEAIVANLRAQVRESRESFLGEGGLFFGFDARIPFTELSQIERELAAARAVLEDINKQVDDLTQKEQAFSAALVNPVVDLQSRWQENKEIIEAIDELYEELFGGQTSIKDETKEVVKENRELQRLIDETRSGRRDELTFLQNQTKELKAQLEIEKQLALEREIARRISPVSRTIGVSSQSDLFPSEGGEALDTPSDLESTVESLEALQVQTFEVSASVADLLSELGIGFSSLGDLQIRTIDSLLESADLSVESFARIAMAASENAQFMSDEWINAVEVMIEQSEELSRVIESGLSNAISSLATGIVEGDPFSALRESIGEFAQDLGKTLIGFGLAGTALDVFIKNPALSIVAGAGLVALGAALKKSAEDKKNDFISGASGDRPAAPGFVDPRQGRTGRFQRDTDAINESRIPTSLQVEIFGDFNLNGSDLTASVERTQRRQGRTRG